MTAVLLDVWVDWSCPHCNVTERTRPIPLGGSRMHTCAGLHMLVAPLVPGGMDCKVVAEERGDYLGKEVQRTGDDGRPYMAVRRERGDGSADAWVFAGVAQAIVS